jgi:hypothetical protein
LVGSKTEVVQFSTRATGIPEICQLDIKVFVQQYVLQFDISMSNLKLRQVLQSRNQLFKQCPANILMQFTLVHNFKKLSVLGKLQHNEGHALLLFTQTYSAFTKVFHHVNNVWRIDPAHNLNFLSVVFETLNGVMIGLDDIELTLRVAEIGLPLPSIASETVDDVLLSVMRMIHSNE